MEIELNALSLKELKDLSTRVERAISSFEERRRKKALAELDEKAREMGFSLAELTGSEKTGRKSRGKAAPKYANPQNPARTWTGRGRKPRWFDEAIAAGKSAEDLLI